MNNELTTYLRMRIAEAGIEGVIFSVDKATGKVHAVEVRKLKEKDVYYVPGEAKSFEVVVALDYVKSIMSPLYEVGYVGGLVFFKRSPGSSGKTWLVPLHVEFTVYGDSEFAEKMVPLLTRKYGPIVIIPAVLTSPNRVYAMVYTAKLAKNNTFYINKQRDLAVIVALKNDSSLTRVGNGHVLFASPENHKLSYYVVRESRDYLFLNKRVEKNQGSQG
ncbi:MAG: hypothetical protein ACP5IE_09000 [Infirmifilum sp.]